MIKLIINIEEQKIKNYKTIKGTDVELEMITTQKNPTLSEKISLCEIRNRLKIDNDYQIINYSSKNRKEIIDELVDELFSI